MTAVEAVMAFLLAAGGAPLDATRHTIDAGGGVSRGGDFVLMGTLGQPDADPLQPSTRGTLSLTGGFWAPMATTSPGGPIFRDGFEDTGGRIFRDGFE